MLKHLDICSWCIWHVLCFPDTSNDANNSHNCPTVSNGNISSVSENCHAETDIFNLSDFINWNEMDHQYMNNLPRDNDPACHMNESPTDIFSDVSSLEDTVQRLWNSEFHVNDTLQVSRIPMIYTNTLHIYVKHKKTKTKHITYLWIVM